ncbi:hypothetical protein ACP_2899 [Acidobacterium capsulatum ATCC 51196]|uniref:Uncharacterized protein n=1 Tax=Acidobacterium capsulatum (strain ATCC 51196 / DSM 11244 / BCRC 80197 / JCM 7670 / NBRC 15755 / NCIMB 13165 / 161) TaxID=240015 RepID=C1F3V8_ACIC5|nr:hypothetical protein ACP_2899 [Acidobacterium capsulatum ATCC 51196]
MASVGSNSSRSRIEQQEISYLSLQEKPSDAGTHEHSTSGLRGPGLARAGRHAGLRPLPQRVRGLPHSCQVGRCRSRKQSYRRRPRLKSTLPGGVMLDPAPGSRAYVGRAPGLFPFQKSIHPNQTSGLTFPSEGKAALLGSRKWEKASHRPSLRLILLLLLLLVHPFQLLQNLLRRAHSIARSARSGSIRRLGRVVRWSIVIHRSWRRMIRLFGVLRIGRRHRSIAPRRQQQLLRRAVRSLAEHHNVEARIGKQL